MREVAFIKQNKDKWLEVEAVLNERKPISPDQMADYYVQLLPRPITRRVTRLHISIFWSRKYTKKFTKPSELRKID